MMQLTTDAAIKRFGDNEERVNKFVNLDGFYTTNEEIPRQVETLPSFIQRMINRWLAFNNRGAWVTATSYQVQDLITVSNIVYVCLSDHVSTVFANDLAAFKWMIYQGVTKSELAANDGSSLLGFVASETGGQYRTILDKSREKKSLEDFYVSTDLGKMNNAFARAAASGVKHIVLTSEEQYVIDDCIPIARSHFIIETDKQLASEIKLLGNADYMFDIGNESQVTSNIQINNLMFLRDVGKNTSKVIRMRNIAYWRIKGARFYMDNKFSKAVEGYSMLYGRILDSIFEHSIDEHVYLYGGTAAAGTLNGRCVENFISDCEAVGANDGTSTPETCGAFIFGDNVEASWLINQRCHSHKGYMAYFRGTVANRPRNTLNLVYNPNVETTLNGAAIAKLENVTSSRIQKGWSSCNGLAGVVFGSGSFSNTFADMQIGISNSADMYQDFGQNNIVRNVDPVGYDSSASTAYRLKSGCLNPIIENTLIYQTGDGVVNEAGANANVIIDGLKYRDLRGTVLSGLNSAGTNKVRRLINQVVAPYYVKTSSTVNFQVGCDDVIQINGTGNIDNFRAGAFFGETVTLRFADAGAVIRDIDNTRGNIANASTGSDITSNGRTILKYRWDGSIWILVQ